MNNLRNMKVIASCEMSIKNVELYSNFFYSKLRKQYFLTEH